MRDVGGDAVRCVDQHSEGASVPVVNATDLRASRQNVDFQINADIGQFFFINNRVKNF